MASVARALAALISGSRLSVGFSSASVDKGAIASGSISLDPKAGNFQHATITGQVSIVPPAEACTVVVELTMGAGAVAPNTSAFTKISGSAFTTTAGHRFNLFVTKTANASHLHVVALQ